ncbi:hypothetical protein LDENG_00272190 [Lucifuga dentata]|nr:hypothetical protein LDENG_00272190 [Lucifuga dentata]
MTQVGYCREGYVPVKKLSTCDSVPAAPGRGVEPGTQTHYIGHIGGQSRGEKQELGVQEWPDGSKYEGEFVNGLKHGTGTYTWKNGEYYKGSFYKDYRHGDGVYCWPTGHRFTGKFYLTRKKGYGLHLFPDGGSFQGLYHADQRFGPGVLTYPDGHQDVGLWDRKYLFRLCSPVGEGFSLKNFPEYASMVDPAATTDFLTQVETDSLLNSHNEQLSDDNLIFTPGIEKYSVDGNHLPLPPSLRREFDQHFYGEQWEPESYQYKGYEQDPLSILPLQVRMQAHIHKHRLQAENVGLNVAAVLSLRRDGFGPKGPLEVSSELLIQQASCGDQQAVSQLLLSGLVHPDVADSRGQTALIAATMNCHNDVIHLLLDMGADIDKLNSEGMSALAVCHILYYPVQSLHKIYLDPQAKTQVIKSQSTCDSLVDFTTDTASCYTRPQSSNLGNQIHLSGWTTEDLTEQISYSSSNHDSNAEVCNGLNESETPTDTEHLQEEEIEEREKWEGDSKETENGRNAREREEDSSCREAEEEVKGEERETEGKHDEIWRQGSEVEGQKDKGKDNIEEALNNGEEDQSFVAKEGQIKNGEIGVTAQEREEVDIEFGERRETESRNEDEEEKIDEDIERRGRDIWEEDAEEKGSKETLGEERSIQVLDGHIAVGSVRWRREGGAKAPRTPREDKVKHYMTQSFDSARSVDSFRITITEEVMQRSAEALSRTGISQRTDTRETVRRMAAMKTEHRALLKTLKLLLERGADPNASRIPMPLLFLAIMSADIEAVRSLLLCGARTNIPLPAEKKGVYPLHIAAALPGPAGPRITELLLHAITDPDTQACDQDEIYELDKTSMGPQEALGISETKPRGGRTALHVACERDSDYRNASEVIALLLSHRANTHLLWSGHSPLSLAIASGNELAMEELLKGGADPNLPLSHRVGSALCALANINYNFGGNKAKMLDMLANAGANILMPIKVGGAVGTAVDYAYYSFNQDSRIANTPYHALNMRERETFRARKHLLCLMGDLLRQTAVRMEREKRIRLQSTSSTQRFVYTGSGAMSPKEQILSFENLPPITDKHSEPLFKFCYYCGRSLFVKLTPCSRCRQVYYCSRTCKLKAWDQLHKEECIRVSAKPTGTPRRVGLKSSPRILRPLSAKEKDKKEVWVENLMTAAQYVVAAVPDVLHHTDGKEEWK